METLKNRHEILFLYDAKDVNPNGDPADENRPRIDEDTNTNIVTDVRLKRTIRDYLHDFLGKEIFIREIRQDGGNIQDAKMRFRDFLDGPVHKVSDKAQFSEYISQGKENILTSCIDIRLFGAVIPVERSKKEKDAVVLVGPVQFRMGRSLNPVEIKYIQGTGAFASGEGKSQKTFREEYIIPYSLIAFYGIVNENAAKDTNMTEDDFKLLLDGIWNGTKNLITRSKVGQMPRLLIDVRYKENNYHIGDLDQYIKMHSDMPLKQVRSIKDFALDVTELVDILSKNKSKIESISIDFDETLTFMYNGSKVYLVDQLKNAGLTVSKLKLSEA